MASIARDPGGRKRILFIDPNGTRRTIRLGKVELRHAELVRVKVEALLSATITRHPPGRETSDWVRSLGDELHSKIARVGLVQPREAHTLGEWLKRFMDARQDLKPSSKRKLEQTRSKLIGFFGEELSLAEITPDDASSWRDDLSELGLSLASVKTHTGNAKTIMREAEQRGIICESPFAHLKGGVTPTKNDRYVTPEETTMVLEAAPDAEWRALFGLARLGGLRTPSETHLLTWGDIDWERGRMRVSSPKTERYTGHESRTVPICPQLMAILQDRFDSATDGEKRVITIKSGGACRRRMPQAHAANPGDRWRRSVG